MEKKLYVVKFNTGAYYSGMNGCSNKLHKAQVYTSVPYAHEAGKKFLDRHPQFIGYKLVEIEMHEKEVIDRDKVSDILIPSKEEWLEYKTINLVPTQGSSFWLRTRDLHQAIAYYVNHSGDISYYDLYYSENGVRPLFRVSGQSLTVGQKVWIGNVICTAVANDLALSDSVVCEQRRDESDAVWEESDLYRFLHSDAFKSLIWEADYNESKN